jgi:hypothetical protein
MGKQEYLKSKYKGIAKSGHACKAQEFGGGGIYDKTIRIKAYGKKGKEYNLRYKISIANQNCFAISDYKAFWAVFSDKQVSSWFILAAKDYQGKSQLFIRKHGEVEYECSNGIALVLGRIVVYDINKSGIYIMGGEGKFVWHEMCDTLYNGRLRSQIALVKSGLDRGIMLEWDEVDVNKGVYVSIKTGKKKRFISGVDEVVVVDIDLGKETEVITKLIKAIKKESMILFNKIEFGEEWDREEVMFDRESDTDLEEFKSGIDDILDMKQKEAIKKVGKDGMIEDLIEGNVELSFNNTTREFIDRVNIRMTAEVKEALEENGITSEDFSSGKAFEEMMKNADKAKAVKRVARIAGVMCKAALEKREDGIGDNSVDISYFYLETDKTAVKDMFELKESVVSLSDWHRGWYDMYTEKAFSWKRNQQDGPIY